MPRLIPAQAGKTRSTGRRPDTRRAHPRSRGENGELYLDDDERRGSSPLTRGKPRSRNRHFLRRGLIPAHAGKTRPPHPRQRGHQAHPRSRGENCISRTRTPRYTGSSPLTRGKQLDSSANVMPFGLIPAHAGKTIISEHECFVGKAHPRSRGENRVRGCRWVWGRGSSPLTRGKRVLGEGLLKKRGLIPAHAGKT